MRLTRRGYALVAIVLLSVILGWRFGARSLNAIAGPSLVALLLAVVQVYRTGTPGVSRVLPPSGPPGESHRMRLEVDVRGTATVRDRLADGLSPRTVERTISGPETLEYEVTFRRRGTHAVGPVSVTVRDVFGLVESEFTIESAESVLVYPRVDSLRAPGMLAGLVDQQGSQDRQAFDSLREYVHGDSLRDVHWKTVAKRQDELVVMEFAAETEGGVTVAAEAASDERAADAMANAAASIVVYLLARGVDAGLVVPGGRLDRSVGEEQRTAALQLLATVSPGNLPATDVSSADVHITADAGGAVVEVGGQRRPFEQLVGTPIDTGYDRNRDRDSPSHARAVS